MSSGSVETDQIFLIKFYPNIQALWMQPMVLLWSYSRPSISAHSIVFKLWGDRTVTNCRNPNPINFPMQILDLLIFFSDICSHTSHWLSRNPRRSCVTDISQSPEHFIFIFPPLPRRHYTLGEMARSRAVLGCKSSRWGFAIPKCFLPLSSVNVILSYTKSQKQERTDRRVEEALRNHLCFTLWQTGQTNGMLVDLASSKTIQTPNIWFCCLTTGEKKTRKWHEGWPKIPLPGQPKTRSHWSEIYSSEIATLAVFPNDG